MGERVRPAAWDRPLPRVLRAIVLDALRLGTGAALPTNAHYLGTVGATAGTIQRAVAVLAEQEALTTTSHGAAGRQIGSLHVGRAWTLAGLAPVRLLLPPSGPVEFDALVDGITDRLTGLGLPHTVRHLRGGSRRLDAVAGGAADVAVVSSGVLGAAADRLGEVPIRQLGPGTYYAAGAVVSVVRAADPPTGPARVAIDRDSPDHTLLTEAAYPADEGYEYVERPFPEVPAAVLRGDVDAGVWHRSPSVVPLDLAGLACIPLGPAATRVWAEISAAALVGAPKRPELRAVLDAVAFD